MTTMSHDVGSAPKMIGNGGVPGRSQRAPTPNTLARLEDARDWHVRGEGGTRHSTNKATDKAITLPMAPPPPKGRLVPAKKVVLEEDDYVEKLGAIIEGDYFPHNAKMQRALKRLTRNAGDATPSGASVLGTPSSAGFETPMGSIPGRGGDGDSNEGNQGRAAGTGGALTRFVARHTSEDNQAFEELQDKDQEAFRRRNFWAYDAANDASGQGVSTKLLILPDGSMMSVDRQKEMDAACADRPKIGDDRPNQVETWKHRTRNQLMFSPNLAASNDTCRIEEEAASDAPLLLAGPTPPPRTRKRQRITQAGEAGQAAAMASPQGDDVARVSGESAQDWLATIRDASTKRASEDAASAAPDNGHSGTSAPDPEEAGGAESTPRGGISSDVDSESESGSALDDVESNTSPPSPSSAPLPGARAPAPRVAPVVKSNPKVIQAHATRFPRPRPRPPRAGKWSSPIESPSSSRESVAELMAGTKADGAKDYAEVPMTPSRVPGVDGDSPQITWGSIDGTPMILDPRATPLPVGVTPDVVDVVQMVGAIDSGAPGGHRFEVKDLPQRERLAHQLEADDTRRKRARGGDVLDGRGTRTAALATPLTPRTPGTQSRAPSSAGTPAGARTPGTRRPRDSRTGAAPTAGPLTPAARTLAAKLAKSRGSDTPFGGGLTPGRQRKRTGVRRGSDGKIDDARTPLPSTPGSQVRGGAATPSGTKERSSTRDAKPSSLTDGLLALK